jgi:hypothetical protein
MDRRPLLLDPGVMLRLMTAEGCGVDGVITLTSGDLEKRVWPWHLGGGKPGNNGVVDDIGEGHCGGRATDEPVLVGPTGAAEKLIGRHSPSMRRADTSILHHVYLLLFTMFSCIIMLFGVFLMPFLS